MSWEVGLDGGNGEGLALNGDRLDVVIDVDRESFGSTGSDWTGENE